MEFYLITTIHNSLLTIIILLYRITEIDRVKQHLYAELSQT